MTFTALVLAGDRTPDDPVARAAGVPCKALALVGGRPMVSRVLDALGTVSAASITRPRGRKAHGEGNIRFD